MPSHPTNRAQRSLSAAKKDKFDWLYGNENKSREIRKANYARAGKVYRKRAIESLQEKEADHELRTYNRAVSVQDPVEGSY